MDQELRQAERDGDSRRLRLLQRRRGLNDCKHRGITTQCCQHLLEDNEQDHIQRFTGKGIEYDLLCQACHQQSPPDGQLRWLCPDCTKTVTEESTWEGLDASLLNIPDRPSYALREVSTHSLPFTPRAISPIENSQDATLILCSNQDIYRFRTDQELENIGNFEFNDHDTDLSLHVSHEGRYIAVTQRLGQCGVVLDSHSKSPILQLDRGDYQNGHCQFSVAFVRHENQAHLIHATAWNRLDLTNLATGELLSSRLLDDEISHQSRNYFQCEVLPSPANHWLAQNGWIWAPVGVISIMDLQAWFGGRRYAPELDTHEICYRDYYWDGPMCWIDDHTLAVYGYGRDDEWLLPAALIFDARTGEQRSWFPGPKGGLAYCDDLISLDPLSVWDIDTGERLYKGDRAMSGVHCGSKLIYELQGPKLTFHRLDPL